MFGVARHETARIICELEANPTDVQFIWKFNNSADTVDIAQSQIHTEKTRSVAQYKPMTELDYGTLLCWGKNEIGTQKEPCVFYINPAGTHLCCKMSAICFQFTSIVAEWKECTHTYV